MKWTSSMVTLTASENIYKGFIYIDGSGVTYLNADFRYQTGFQCNWSIQFFEKFIYFVWFDNKIP